MCDAEYANSAMPNYAGFVFSEKSRRNVSPEQARELRAAIAPEIKPIGVFVNVQKEQIAALYRENIISVIQLHGSEGDAYIAQLRNILPDAVIWKAYKVGE